MDKILIILKLKINKENNYIKELKVLKEKNINNENIIFYIS